MGVSIGPRIGIEGEAEYRKSINEMITQAKTFSSEMRELESSFDDNTSAMEKNRKKSDLLNKQIKTQEELVGKLEDQLQKATDEWGENDARTQKWKQAVSNAKTELNKLNKELKDTPSSLQNIGQEMQKVGEKMEDVGDTMTKYVTAPLAAMAAASVAAWKEVDEGADTVAKKTGATGKALEGLQTSMKNIATTIPTSFETAGEAVGEVNTRFHLTGEELEGLSTQFIKFAEINDTDVTSSVDKTQKIMAAYGLEVKDAGSVLDVMTKTSQDTGLSVDRLADSMLKNSASLQEMGMDAYDAAGFLGGLEVSGIDVNTAMTGMQKAMVNAAKEGKSLPDALSGFQSVLNSSASDQEKLNAAIDLFGAKTGPAIYAACQSGSLSFENLSKDASYYIGTVETTFDNVVDPIDDMQVSMNRVKEAGEKIGGVLLKQAAPAVESLAGFVEDAGTWFANLNEEEQNMLVSAAVVAAGSGIAIKAVGGITETVGTAIEKFGELKAAGTILNTLTNPVAGVIAGVTIAATAIHLASEHAKKADESLTGVLEANAGAEEALEEATQSLTDCVVKADAAIGEINAKADVASDLINELEALEKQSELTGEEQARMKILVGELNAMYPELSLQIDTTTGSLNKGTQEIKDYVEKAKDLALLNAYTKAAEDGYVAMANASIELKKAQNQQQEAQELLNKKIDDYNKANGTTISYNSELDEWYEGNGDNATSLAMKLSSLTDSQQSLNTSVDEAQAAYDECKENVKLYEEEAGKLQTKLDSASEAGDSAAESAGKVGEAAATAAGQVSDAADSMGEDYEDIADAATNSAEEQVKAWRETYKTERENVKKQTKLFDELKVSYEMTAKDIADTLAENNAAKERYSDNMAILFQHVQESNDPYEKQFLQDIAEMGLSAAGEVDAMVKSIQGDGQEYGRIMDEYRKSSDLDDTIASQTATFKTGTGLITQFAQNAYGPGGSIAKAMLGLIPGMSTAMEGVDSEAKTKSSSTVTGMQGIFSAAKLVSTVSQIGVPGGVISTAVSIMTGGLKPSATTQKINTSKSTIEAGQKEINKSFTVKATVTKIDGVETTAAKARAQMERKLQNIRATVGSASTNVQREYAEGGIVTQEQIARIGEENKPEAIIPLAAEKRTRALSLYEQVGEILGVEQQVERATVEPTHVTMPSHKSSGQKASFSRSSLEDLFEVVASAAREGSREGMGEANLTVYVGDREVGRILRKQGVAFA